MWCISVYNYYQSSSSFWTSTVFHCINSIPFTVFCIWTHDFLRSFQQHRDVLFEFTPSSSGTVKNIILFLSPVTVLCLSPPFLSCNLFFISSSLNNPTAFCLLPSFVYPLFLLSHFQYIATYIFSFNPSISQTSASPLPLWYPFTPSSSFPLPFLPWKPLFPPVLF